jgi:hypothetical protein
LLAGKHSSWIPENVMDSELVARLRAVVPGLVRMET